MIKRYANAEIDRIWANPNKLALWQATEIAVIQARANLEIISQAVYREITGTLQSHPIDLDWWLVREKEVRHDLQAFIDERLRFLPSELQQYFHQGMTSYDTEEPSFSQMLLHSVALVEIELAGLKKTLEKLALEYQYTIMNGRTHGQEAELQTFGKRCLTWYRAVMVDAAILQRTQENLAYSKISGAIGNYGGMDPKIEAEALRLMGMKPFYGATQIMPRELYAPLAQALCQIVLTLDKIAIDIRLGARSGRPIYQEPFGKKQKGSSKMPHKKNTISTEQLEGMARMAQGFLQMILQNIRTWEERAIEQSCVERVAWPDLFHIVLHSLKTLTGVLDGLVVYADNMMWEVVDSRGCYASGEAKDFLRERVAAFGLASEDAYRMVQLAAFNAFEPSVDELELRTNLTGSFEGAKAWLLFFQKNQRKPPVSIQHIIINGQLRVSSDLDVSSNDVQHWNGILKQIFADSTNLSKWNEIFTPAYLLRHEATLYKEILGV